jgi:hypothetical protein
MSAAATKMGVSAKSAMTHWMPVSLMATMWSGRVISVMGLLRVKSAEDCAQCTGRIASNQAGRCRSRAQAAHCHRFAFAQSKVRTRILELHAEVASKLSDDAALTVQEHMVKLRELRDEARQRGQLSAAIQAEVKRGELRRFYVKQVETGDAGEFSRMSDEELRAFVYGDDELPPKPGPVKH